MRRLRDLQVLSPCQERWEEMQGDAKTRYCERCQHSVHDLSEMTRAEAETVVASGPLCVRLTRDASGEVLTKSAHHQRLLLLLRAYAEQT